LVMAVLVCGLMADAKPSDKTNNALQAMHEVERTSYDPSCVSSCEGVPDKCSRQFWIANFVESNLDKYCTIGQYCTEERLEQWRVAKKKAEDAKFELWKCMKCEKLECMHEHHFLA